MTSIRDLEKNYLSMVVYVHNDVAKLLFFLREVYGVVSERFENFEFIFVDDASFDGSGKLIKEFFRGKKAAVTLLTTSFYQGVEPAMVAGVDFAVGDYIFEFDSVVLTYPSATIMDVYYKAIAGNDIVVASPRSHGRMGSKIYYSVFNRFSGINGILRTEAFRIVSRRAVNRVYSMTSIIPYRKAAYAGCGLPTECIFYELVKKYPLADEEERIMQKNIAIDILVLYTDVASKFAMALSCVMIFFTIFCCVYIVGVYLVGKPVPGYVSTFALLSFGFFGVNSLLAILIKYVSLNLRINFKKQKYMIRSVEKV